MKIAVSGGGSLNMQSTVRDGSVADRLELFRGLDELGVESLYVGPKRFSPDSERVPEEGWGWRGEVDALVIEIRFSYFPPKNTLIWDEYLQGRVIEDWHNGLFGDAQLYIVDFDAMTRRAMGFAGVKSSANFMNTKLRDRDVPLIDMDAYAHAAEVATVLCPYYPPAAPLETKRVEGQTYRTARWLWPYPVDMEVEPIPWRQRSLEMFYPGSDYNRREKFWKYYVEGAAAGARVEVSGVWKNSRKGDDGPGWKGRGFKAKCLEHGGDKLKFLNESIMNMPYDHIHRQLRRAKSCVQIVSNIGIRRYEDIGYYTIRPAECAAAGVLPFVDSDIGYHDDIVPHPFWRVSSFEEMRDKMRSIRGGEIDAVMMWREHLRKVGTGVERAQQLLDLMASYPEPVKHAEAEALDYRAAYRRAPEPRPPRDPNAPRRVAAEASTNKVTPEMVELVLNKREAGVRAIDICSELELSSGTVNVILSANGKTRARPDIVERDRERLDAWLGRNA